MKKDQNNNSQKTLPSITEGQKNHEQESIDNNQPIAQNKEVLNINNSDRQADTSDATCQNDNTSNTK